ncbi:hypothetical protein [Candidatus Electronema sp. PJ]|uniref:hypothetical protein n=1 Tax=Candidatus Electronema sp. PJ TaxID=3401572 RepID=UPI003AA98B80
MKHLISVVVACSSICMFAACDSQTSQQPVLSTSYIKKEPVKPKAPTYPEELVSRGAAIHKEALARTEDARLDVWGTGFPSVQACIWIPEDQWKALSIEDREAFITYLKAQVPAIRSNPDRYTGIPEDAPAYKRIRDNIANMKDGAFIIFTMVQDDGRWIQSGTVAESK